MTTKVEQEEVAESKTATVVKQQIKWRNVVLLTVVHLLALYAVVFEIRREKLMTSIWCRYRLSVRYTPTPISKYSSYEAKQKHRK
jgi:hypothetical protein